MTEPLLSVIVPNHKTPEQTKICLRLLRKYTEPGKIRVIVIDNDSRDDSVKYLRHLRWISLLERQASADEPGFVMFARSLDEAFVQVDTPYVLVMHTDTFVLRPDWLDYVLGHFDSAKVAGIGSWKLEAPLSRTGCCIRRLKSLFCKKRERTAAGEVPYLRSHFAVYRSELIRKHTSGFYDGQPAGKSLHEKLAAAGFDMIFLPPEELSYFVCHLNCETMDPDSGGCITGNAPVRFCGSQKTGKFSEVLEAGELDL